MPVLQLSPDVTPDREAGGQEEDGLEAGGQTADEQSADEQSAGEQSANGQKAGEQTADRQTADGQTERHIAGWWSMPCSRAPLSETERVHAGAIWARLRAQLTTPADEAACRLYIKQLRRAGLRDAALAVAQEAAERAESAAWGLEALAAICRKDADQTLVLAIGRALQAKMPTSPAGPRIALEALRTLDQMDEAAALFASLPPQFAGLAWYHWEGAQIAAGAGRTDAALAHARRYRALSPRDATGALLECRILRDADRLQEADGLITAALILFPRNSRIWLEAGAVAEALARYDLAQARYQELRANFPASADGYVGAIKLYALLEAFDDAERLIDEGLARHPGNQELLLCQARVAKERDAARQWQAEIEAAPDKPHLRLRAAAAMARHRANRKARLPRYIERLTEITARFPRFLPAHVRLVDTLRDLGRLDAADELAAAWMERFAHAPELAVAWARISEDRGCLPEALRRLEAARDRVGANDQLDCAIIRVNRLLGHVDLAEERCAAVLRADPVNLPVLYEFTQAAIARGDWRAAIDRASEALRLRPGYPRFLALLQTAQIQNGAEEGAAGDARPVDVQDLFDRFESLGATLAGCEFGLVQRKFGAEPLGLLRWSRIRLAGLITAFETGFEGVGSAAATTLRIRDEGAYHQEYYVYDTRFGLEAHTGVKAEDISEERMMAQTLRRMSFLRAKLIEDLRAGDKVFVYKINGPIEDEAPILRLHDAMGRYAPCSLLCAAMADARHPRGTLRTLRPRLFIGYFDQFMGARLDTGVDFDLWHDYCARAWALARPLAQRPA